MEFQEAEEKYEQTIKRFEDEWRQSCDVTFTSCFQL